jgi:hypothetical protein
MSEQDKNGNKRHQEEEQRRQREAQASQHPGGRMVGGEAPDDATRIANPAQLYAQTKVPERAKASDFMAEDAESHPDGYPKLLYHPVHGGIEIADPGEESRLRPRREWFDSPELADAARTHTEAEIVRFNNQLAKMGELAEKGLPMVRNSVQADEGIRRNYPEPL